MLNAGSTVTTALLRAIVGALVTGAITGLGILQQSNDDRTAVIAGLIAGLTYFSTRGLGEGSYDVKRQVNGEVSAGDVQAIGEGKAL